MSGASEVKKQDAGECGPGCACGRSGSGNRVRWAAGAVILLAAGVLVVRAVFINKGAPADQPAGVAALPAAVKESGAEVGMAAVPAAVKEIGALSELDAAAADTGGVFVYLAGPNDPPIRAPLGPMRSAAKTIGTQTRIKMGLFILKTDSADYGQIAQQMPVPGVVVMVKGGGMVPVSGDLTESKLIQGFVAASSSGGCGGGGCGPSGCN